MMRWNTKKLLLIFVVLILFCSSITYAQAAVQYSSYAEKLAEINVIIGTGEGFELDREPTRLEGLVVLIRLLGAEEEALASKNYTFAFDDVPGWGKGYVQYAHENGLTNGISQTKFGADNVIDAKSYLTFLLRALGYSDKDGDFTWQEATEYAKETGLISEFQYNELSSQTFLRDHLAKTSFDALNTFIKDTNQTLLEYLVEKGIIDARKADTLLADRLDEAGLEQLKEACVAIEVETSDGVGSGSGFYINNNGKIITNYHVIRGATAIKVVNNDGSVHDNITIMGYSKNRDIAILNTNALSEDYLRIGDSDTVKTDQRVYTIGSPGVYRNKVSEGIISAVRENDLQITAPIGPGSSGGALINEYGEVIGITYAIHVGGENIGFAIPINEISTVSDDLNLSVAEFTEAETVNLDDYETYIKNEFDSIILNGQNIEIDNVYLSEEGERLYFVDLEISQDLNTYLNAERIGRDDLLDDLAEYAYIVSGDLNADVFFQISYVAVHDQYPIDFMSNDILDEFDISSIDYMTDGTWSVYYPVVYVYVNAQDYSYYYGFWSE